ncbi:MAG: DNA-binding protein [Candidatus Kapaibacteriota bacterium]
MKPEQLSFLFSIQMKALTEISRTEDDVPSLIPADRRNKKLLLLGIFLLALISTSTCFAQELRNQQGSGGWGMPSPYSKMFDPRAVETIKGEVLAIKKIIPLKGMSSGLQVMVRTETDTIAAHLGPDWFLEYQDVQIERQDIIEIKGSRITFDGKSILIATEVLRRTDILRLRNINGFPAWTAWKRR